MAHENLKFQLSLTKNDIWQPVFGAQHHGTFYMIYIKIKSYEEVKNEFGKIEHTYDCDFRLQNYRGAITIGLAGSKTPKFTTDTSDANLGDILNINLEVKPFTKKDYLNDVKLKLVKPIESNLITVINVFVLSPPKNLFDPNDLDNSLYLNPYTHLRDGDEYTEVAFRKSGTNQPFQSPANMGWPGMGFCIPDICIFD
nr:hypothetical protein [uncultured Psychroserpens sp.]